MFVIPNECRGSKKTAVSPPNPTWNSAVILKVISLVCLLFNVPICSFRKPRGRNHLCLRTVEQLDDRREQLLSLHEQLLRVSTSSPADS